MSGNITDISYYKQKTILRTVGTVDKPSYIYIYQRKRLVFPSGNVPLKTFVLENVTLSEDTYLKI